MNIFKPGFAPDPDLEFDSDLDYLLIVGHRLIPNYVKRLKADLESLCLTDLTGLSFVLHLTTKLQPFSGQFLLKEYSGCFDLQKDK